tara:strand:+ start:130 stop:414 length:285 start_codon:yes stop_codon:yes gene_type:complete
MLGTHEQQIVDGLNEERAELLSYGYTNLEIKNRVEELDRQISEIVGGDTFRSHELDNGEEIDEVSYEAIDLDDGFDGNSNGFISQSFVNPDLNY